MTGLLARYAERLRRLWRTATGWLVLRPWTVAGIVAEADEVPDRIPQWTGDPVYRRDERFRAVLCDLGLKDGGVWDRGGWNCYITNVPITETWSEMPHETD